MAICKFYKSVTYGRKNHPNTIVTFPQLLEISFAHLRSEGLSGVEHVALLEAAVVGHRGGHREVNGSTSVEKWGNYSKSRSSFHA